MILTESWVRADAGGGKVFINTLVLCAQVELRQAVLSEIQVWLTQSPLSLLKWKEANQPTFQGRAILLTRRAG